MTQQLSVFEIEELTETLSMQDEDATISIVLAGDAGIQSMHELPDTWQQILASRDEAPMRAMAHWSGLRYCLPNTVAELERCLHEVALVMGSSHGPLLLYVFRQSDDVLGQLGRMPTSFVGAQEIPESVRQLVGDFYSIHDGWVDLYSGDGGPLPVPEWHAVRPVEGSGPGLLVTYADGGHFVGFSVEEGALISYALWPDDEDVERLESFWRHVDEKIAAGLEDCDGLNSTT